MVDTANYTRRPFEVAAVRVTEENMADVAVWCLGNIRTEVVDGVEMPYIHVRVLRALNTRQTQAFVGDWVLYAGTSFKCYKNAAFHAAFALNPEKNKNEDK
jgi:hypothetical protein